MMGNFWKSLQDNIEAEMEPTPLMDQGSKLVSQFVFWLMLIINVHSPVYGQAIVAWGFCGLGILLGVVTWRYWRKGERLSGKARLLGGLQVLLAPLTLGAAAWVLFSAAFLPRLQWQSAIGTAALGYAALIWTYDAPSGKEPPEEDAAPPQRGAKRRWATAILLAVSVLAIVMINRVPETALPGAEPLRRLEEVQSRLGAFWAAEDAVWHYEDKGQQIDYYKLGAESLWVYYDRSGKTLRGAFWEHGETGERRTFNGARWQQGPAPAGWLTQLPQPLLPDRDHLAQSHYTRDMFYDTQFTEADLWAQDFPWPRLTSYEEITADYAFWRDGTISYSFSAYGRDDRGIPETLYHSLALRSSQRQAVAEMLNKQKRALAFDEGGEE